MSEKQRATVHRPFPHDSATAHVTGEAVYVDDMPEPAGTLEIFLARAAPAHARIEVLDLEPVREHPGVACVLAAGDIPGINDISPTHKGDEPVFAQDRILFCGQPLFAVAADHLATAREAAERARIEVKPLPPVLSIEEARRRGDLVTEGMVLERGDLREGLRRAPARLRGSMRIGGQDHFYLEGQVALALPGENGEMRVWSSTQHPSEVQQMIARVLGIAAHKVTVTVRRMGGGFGGKETQASPFACIAALVAAATGRPAKLRLDRDEDMILTGKRHDFLIDYEVGFDGDGRIRAVKMELAARCGFSADLSGPVTDRALFHADNCYFYPAVRLESFPCRTNTVSNTAFRGFGGPQGMLAAERVIEEVAFATGLDPLEVRRRNFYGSGGRDITPYHMRVEEEVFAELVETLAAEAGYEERREAVRAFNRENRWLRKGLALTPVKFGIAFTATWYNQAGALLHIYRDGSVQLNHGGTEMGQGLHIKVLQVVAEELALPIERIAIAATSTGRVPNTSATAASSGSDLNGMAARNAARTLKQRLIAHIASRWQVPIERVAWLPGRVRAGEREMVFEELVEDAYLARVPLSATGFYRTPKIHWDRGKGRGRPFLYFACGAAMSEVIVDTLTGEYRVERVDILHDVGDSLNPAVDLGQIEGGFVQGMGWLTTEELWWDGEGRLRTHAPSTYKIPACGDRPAVMNIRLLEGRPNREETIYRSKAVGEPPLMLAISVLHALSDAVASIADHRICPRLDPPATPERVLDAVSRMRQAAARMAAE